MANLFHKAFSASVRTYAFVQALSLDVVLGAWVGAHFVGKLFQKTPSKPAVYALCAAVWVIYTLDHLLDAHRIKGKASTPRHRLHQRYFWPLAGLAFLVLALGAWQAWQLSPALWQAGLGLSGGVIFYFLLLNSLGRSVSVQKEFLIALGYATGVCLAPLVEQGSFWVWWVWGEFFLLALLNLVLFAFFEAQVDEKDGSTSFVRLIGRRRARWMLHSTGASLLGLLSWGLLRSSDLFFQGQMVLLGMALCLAVPAFFPRFFAQHERYRILGDGIFFLPMLWTGFWA